MASDPLMSKLAELQAAAASERHTLFVEYCRLIATMVHARSLPMRDGAYRICGTASYLRDLSPTERRIMNLACRLELSKEQGGLGDADWNELVRLIEEGHTQQ